MTRPVVCLVFQSPNVGKSIAKSLSATLEGHVEILAQHITELEAGPLEADYFVVPSNRVAEIVKRVRPQARTMVSGVRLNVQDLPKLLRLRPGITCLVVAGSQETAEDTVRLLKESGFSWLNFNPYWPGKTAQVLEAEVAITPGSPHLCPTYIPKMIDLGPRRLDIMTLVRLCLDLDLPRKALDNILAHYVSDVTAQGRAYLELYQESEHDRAYLKALLDSTKDAIAAFDINGAVMHSNTYFQHLMEGAKLDLGKFLDNQVVTPSVEQIKRKYFVVEKFLVKIQQESAPVGTLLVMRSTEKVSEAERALRRALLSRGHVGLHHFSDIIGISPQIKKAVETARRIASNNLTVLITGETGTGKELFAHAIHNASPRAEEPFVCSHFAAMAPTLIESELFGYDEGAFTGAKKGGHPGYFEQAHGGSIFLDEIGDAPLIFQSHLLRVLEDKRVMRVGGSYPIPIDVRVITATNQNLETLVKQGRFREDLFYRLNVIQLSLPPLRSRAEDIPILAKHFLSLVDRPGNRRFSPEVLNYLQEYSWPGNIRQLQSVVNHMAHTAESEILVADDLPPSLAPTIQNPAPSADDCKSILMEWGPHGNLVFLILETLALFQGAGRTAGKKALMARAREQDHRVSDHQMRKLLSKLNCGGFVHVGSTSQGTAITAKGLTLLHSFSS